MQPLQLTQHTFFDQAAKRVLRRLIGLQGIQIHFTTTRTLLNAAGKENYGYGQPAISARMNNDERTLKDKIVLKIEYPEYHYLQQKKSNPVKVLSTTGPTAYQKTTSAQSTFCLPVYATVEGIYEIREETTYTEANIIDSEKLNKRFGKLLIKTDIPTTFAGLNVSVDLQKYLVLLLSTGVVIIEKLDSPFTFQIHHNKPALWENIQEEINTDYPGNKKRYTINDIS